MAHCNKNETKNVKKYKLLQHISQRLNSTFFEIFSALHIMILKNDWLCKPLKKTVKFS